MNSFASYIQQLLKKVFLSQKASHEKKLNISGKICFRFRKEASGVFPMATRQ